MDNENGLTESVYRRRHIIYIHHSSVYGICVTGGAQLVFPGCNDGIYGKPIPTQWTCIQTSVLGSDSSP